MLPFTGLAVAAALVGLGYLALWTANRADTPRALSTFGRVMAIVLMCVAGLTLLAGAVAGPMGMLRGRVFGPGRHLARAFDLDVPLRREIRIEKRLGDPCVDEEEETFELFEEFIEESDEFEERVREIVEETLEDKGLY